MNKTPFSLTSASGALLAAILLCGCEQKQHTVPTEEKLPTATVRVEAVQIQPRTATEEVVGTVRPRLSASISSKISGVVQQMLVSPGQRVKKGELLVQLDAREIQARLDQAQAVREQTQKDIQRFEILLKQSALTQQEFDAAQARFRVADATVTEAQTMLGYAKVIAPFDGVITAKHADVGDLAAPGKSLLDLEDPTTLRFEADVPDALISKIKLQDKLTVRVSPINSTIKAVVSEIAPAADPASRTYRVKLDLSGSPDLRSGQFGRVAVPVAEVNALRVPASAINVRGQMEIAFVVTNQHAQMRLVKTGKQLEGAVEIVSGLNSGEQLVIEGTDKLIDRQPVEVKQ
jgi:RND family efflux transporter MFP subunit